jgi:hypothetical protein
VLKFKLSVEIWKLGTSVTAARQAALCILAIMDPKARDFAARLKQDELKKPDTGRRT